MGIAPRRRELLGGECYGTHHVKVDRGSWAFCVGSELVLELGLRRFWDSLRCFACFLCFDLQRF